MSPTPNLYIANLCEVFQISSRFTVLELIDIREQVKRSYGLVAAGFRQAVDSLERDIAAQLAKSAAIIDQFSELKPLGYLLLAAQVR